MRRLPPLSAVRVFEAAARHENFTAAAAELGMTQAAVSHQIRVLEDRLGQQLFRRERQRVLLTDAGRRAALRAGRGLDEIEAAFAELRAEDDSALTISTTVTFANTWLAWRLGRFQVSHPDVAVRLSADNGLTDFAAHGVDVAIRLGEAPWPGLAAHRLVTVDFTPMCSPRFLADYGGHIAPEDLLHLPLISPGEPIWAQWLRDAGLSAPTVRAVPGVQLDTQANEGHAAMADQGVAMLTPFLWRHDLADGRLTRLFPLTATLGQAFWLVYPEHRRRSAKIRRFREWLEAEVALTQTGLEQG
ncbi:MAG: transcriptional regulator GcvA [Caulobacter sp.]|nr:transcriptional regulator GcvA [Caulobacter sp.]